MSTVSQTKTAAAPEPPGAAARAASWTWRTRDPMAPIWCTAGAFTSGAIAHGLPDHWWGIAAPAAYGAVAAWRLDRDHSRALVRTRGDWMFHGTVTAAFGIWMIPAAAGGISLGLAETALAGMAVFGGVWWTRSVRARIATWWRNRKKPAATPEPVKPAVQAPTHVDELVEDWYAYLAGDRGPLAGARLTDTEELVRPDTGKVYALRATVTGVRGKHTTAGLIAAAETIRSGLGLPPGAVLVDGTDATGHTAHLTVLVGDSPLRTLPDHVVTVTGAADPTSRWTATIGEFPDSAPIQWTYYIPDSGAVHGITAGDSGTGKGVTTDKVVMGAAKLGAVVLLLDTKDGRSSSVGPLISGIAVTAPERLLLLTGLIAEARRRNRVMAASPWTDRYGNLRNTMPGTDPPTAFTPTADMPLIYVIVEEIATQIEEDAEFAPLLGTAAREFRACGIGLDVIGQGISTREIGGATLRANVAQNVLMLRTKNPLTGQRLGDAAVPLDPFRLPSVWPGTSEPALGLCVPAGLCAGGKAEMGRVYPNGNLVPQVQELAASLAALTEEAAETLNLRLIAQMRADRLAGRGPIPVPDLPARIPAARAEPASAEPEDTSTRDLILNVLQSVGDPMTTSDLAAELTARDRPVSPQNLGNHLGKLIETGQITRVARATYQAVFDAELMADRALVTR
jgi:hypothetical protein